MSRKMKRRRMKCPDCKNKLERVGKNWRCNHCCEFFDDDFIQKKNHNKDLNEMW